MVSLTTVIVCMLLMGLCTAATHRVLTWSLQAIQRDRRNAAASGPELSMVDTVDRRTQQLPFVGQDRRQSETVEQAASVAHTGTSDALPSNVKPFKRRD